MLFTLLTYHFFSNSESISLSITESQVLVSIAETEDGIFARKYSFLLVINSG